MARDCSLHARGARKTLPRGSSQARLAWIIGMGAQHVRQAHRVFHRHAGALREILQHRVRGIAQQRDTAVDPALDRIAVAQYPELPVLAMANDILRTLVDMRETLHHFVVGHRLAGDRLGRVVVAGDDEVEHFPARQRIMHEMAFRAGPQRGRVPAQVLRHLLGRDHRTIGRMAGNPRRAVADDLLADVRPQPVGADQRRAGDAFAGGKERRNRCAVLVIARDFGADAQFDQAWSRHAFSNTPCRSPRCTTA